MATIAKVTAFITRQSAHGPELCVFEHPTDGVQLPAGTLPPGENARAGALREGFEETGLDGLQFQSELDVLPACAPGEAIVARPITLGAHRVSAGALARVLEQGADHALIQVDGASGIVKSDALAFDAMRHLVHLTLDAEAADQWFVVTPDGGGHCWRCHWRSLDDIDALHHRQQPWLAAARDQLRQAKHPPARRRLVVDSEVDSDLTIELFWAAPWSQSSAHITWLDPHQAPADADIERVEAIPLTDAADVIAVAGGTDKPYWVPPGGHREIGERLEDTLRREVREEASADVRASKLLGIQRCRHLNGSRAGQLTFEAIYWARVDLKDFVPNVETHARRLLPLSSAYKLGLWHNPLTQRALDKVVDIEAQLRKR